MKFGGSSVGSIDNWPNIKHLAQSRLEEGYRTVIVCSALKGVTNLLDRLCQGMPRDQIRPHLDRIYEKHDQMRKHFGLKAAFAADFDNLKSLALEHCHRRVQPRLKAEIMAHGEIMSTRLIAAYLADEGLDAEWQDARKALRADQRVLKSDGTSSYLQAECDFSPDRELQQRWGDLKSRVLVTQGFIASNPNGRTVLLGRGGSDTSAAYFAAKLQAERLEIWTDVPGMFSANPLMINEARQLRRIDYQEATILANMGAKVLHPRCVDPAAEYDIPILVNCTSAPDVPGTLVCRAESSLAKPVIKAVITRANLRVITSRARQDMPISEFLRQFFGAAEEFDVRLDPMAMSETAVQGAVDPAFNTLTSEDAQVYLKNLREFSDTEVKHDAGSLSVVGQDVNQLGPALSKAMASFGEQQIYFIGGEESGGNMTFVLGGDVSGEVLKRMHGELIESSQNDQVFGPAWQDLMKANDDMATEQKLKAAHLAAKMNRKD